MRGTRTSLGLGVVLIVATGLTAGPAHAGHLILAQTTYDASGTRNLSGGRPFDVVDPTTGNLLEMRQWKFTTPENFATRAPGSVNLWFVFHGGGGSTDSMNRYFEVIPPSSPTVMIFPEALVNPTVGETRWRNVQFPGDEIDPASYRDIVFIEQLRDGLLSANPQLSADHVYASGFSSGGAMTWMLLCYRSSLFNGFGFYAKQLQLARLQGGCGDGHAPAAPGGPYNVITGYEIMTGQVPDFYGHNPAIGSFAPSKPVFYHHGTLDQNLEYSGAPGCYPAMMCAPDEDPNYSMTGPGTPLQNRDDIATVAWLLERNDLTPRSNRAVIPDEDPLNGNDVVTTYARRFKKSQKTPGVTSRGTVMWFELDGHTHAISTLNHYNDMCDNLTGVGPGMTPCNVNPNASKDFYTSLANLEFFEQFAGLMR